MIKVLATLRRTWRMHEADRVITDRDIARWRLHSQLLAAPVGGAEEVVWSLLAVQAENPSQSAWAVATRTTSPRQGDLADAIADGRVLRTHVLRPTWHYVHADDAQWLLELTAPRVLPTVDQQPRPLADRMTALTDAVEAILTEASNRTRADLSGPLADRGVELTGQQLGCCSRISNCTVCCAAACGATASTPTRSSPIACRAEAPRP